MDDPASSKKRRNKKILLSAYLLISFAMVIGIAVVVYHDFIIDRSPAPTPTNPWQPTLTTLVLSKPLPSDTPALLPSETPSIQSSATSTINPYPISTKPIIDELLPTETTIPSLTISPIINTSTALPDEPLMPTPISNPIYPQIPSKTPTRIKNPCPCSHDLYDCKDFSTHALAQACYDYCILTGWGDAHHLDKGGTGIVCKGLP